MTWFTVLTGCPEGSPSEVRRQLTVEGSLLISRANGRSWLCGELEIPTLAELRQRISKMSMPSKATTVREIVAHVQRLHVDKDHALAFFQVASQFNLLEMATYQITPEQGVGIYELDRTQGPACAIAAGAGTIYRNYFAPVNGHIGQTADNQIDCLADMGALLGNTNSKLWRMVNGYALPSAAGLTEIDEILRDLDEAGCDHLRRSLRIGLQWHTQVTLGNPQRQNISPQLVSQAYCSALPVAYTEHSRMLWARFARLVLEASYEATFCAAILNAEQTQNKTLFLTLLGGGAFGNDPGWIVAAIRRSLALYAEYGLDVVIVSYGRTQECVQPLIRT